MRRCGTTRRAVLKMGAAGGAGTLLAGSAGGGGAGAARAQEPPAEIPPFELEEVSISTLRQRMESGELTSARATRLYLERIEALDGATRSILGDESRRRGGRGGTRRGAGRGPVCAGRCTAFPSC